MHTIEISVCLLPKQPMNFVVVHIFDVFKRLLHIQVLYISPVLGKNSPVYEVDVINW